MEKDIINKLKVFFDIKGFLFKEEYEVVYFLVEARKIIEHQRKNNDYKFLRFYVDWALHTKKDRYFTKEVRKMIENAHLSIVSNKVSFDKLEEFILDFHKFKSDLEIFLKNNNLPINLTENKGLWKNFVNIYTDIISDQYIELPIETKMLIINVKKDDNIVNININKRQIWSINELEDF